jgi:hypothetical protein
LSGLEEKHFFLFLFGDSQIADTLLIVGLLEFNADSFAILLHCDITFTPDAREWRQDCVAFVTPKF